MRIRFRKWSADWLKSAPVGTLVIERDKALANSIYLSDTRGSNRCWKWIHRATLVNDELERRANEPACHIRCQGQ